MEEKTAFINGRSVSVPSVASSEELVHAGHIAPGRQLILKRRDGSYALKPGQQVRVMPGDHFADAPRRTKG